MLQRNLSVSRCHLNNDLMENFFCFLACGFMQVFDLYGVGLRQVFPTPNLLKELNLKVLLPHHNVQSWKHVQHITEFIDRYSTCSSCLLFCFSVSVLYIQIYAYSRLENSPLVTLWICPLKMKRQLLQMMPRSRIWR